MVAAFLVEGDTFRAEKPHQWSSAVMSPRGPFRNFDLHPDGQRFAVMKASEDVAEVKRDRLTLVLNFEDELRRIAPVR
jgi:hypothetical protein